MSIKTEVKAGLFVFFAFLVFFIIVFSISDFSLKEGYTFSVKFNFVNGLDTSAPVRLAGVKIGEVRAIKVSKGYPPVEVLIWVRKGVPISKDAQVYVSSLGLLGEKYIEFFPGRSSILIKEGDTIIGQDPISVQQLSHLTKHTIRKINEVARDIEELIGDKEVRKDIKGLIKSSKNLSEELSGLVKEANKSLVNFNLILTQINSGQGTVGKLIKEEELYNEIKEVVEDIKKHPWKLFRKTRERKRRRR